MEQKLNTTGRLDKDESVKLISDVLDVGITKVKDWHQNKKLIRLLYLN